MTNTDNTVPAVIDGVFGSEAPKKKRGRPKKSDIEAAKKPGKVGRPKETTGRIQELKARLLATSGERVLNEIIRKALDPTDKDQIAALKMCIDRVLPISLFEKGAGKSNSVQIQIINTSDNAQTVINGSDDDDDITDIEYTETNGET